jgi:predicted metal-binding membrane protein
MTEHTDVLSTWLKRDQLFVFIGLILLAVIAWAYILHLNSAMSSESMDSMISDVAMPQMNQWDAKDVATIAIMWSVMMIAMMLPSAAPMIIIFSTVNRKRYLIGNLIAPTWIFLSGYLLVWIGFSLIATGGQWSLHNLSLISPGMKIINPFASGIVLIAAGIYQFTPIKDVCLKNCHSPLDFIMGNWRDGKLGALSMGLQHGKYCVGCCWAFMILLFVGGVMNLLWVAMIAIFVFIEKVAPVHPWLSKVAGFLLVAWGFGIISIYVSSSYSSYF